MHEISLPHGTMTRFPAVGVNKNALILCPGGGYEMTSDREAEPDLALPLDSLGETGEITLETGKEALV